MNRSKVLIFSVPFGTGHNRAAEAIGKAFRQIGASIDSYIVDSIAYAAPVFGRLITGTYMEILKISPRLYRFLYDKAESSLTRNSFTQILKVLMASKLCELINKENPDVVICTHPFPLGVLSRMQRKGELNVPLVAVVTDFSFHTFWLYDNVDLFIVGVEDLKQALIKNGVPAQKIRVTGIPIDPQFEQFNGNSTDIMNKLGLDPGIATVLVMGGGLGMGSLAETVNTIANCDYPLQILVITGKNVKLREKLGQLEKRDGIKIKVFGHVDNIHEFMEVADLVVTKPGGLTSAEALAKGLPLVLINPIPGQEERNLNYLTTTEVAVSLNDKKDLAELIVEVLGAPDRIARMHATAKQLGRPTAAQEAARALADLITVHSMGRSGS